MTPRMRDTLYFIGNYWRDEGCAPTYREMAVALEVGSTSAVSRLVASLEERGFVKKQYCKHRSVELTPEGAEKYRAGTVSTPARYSNPSTRSLGGI